MANEIMLITIERPMVRTSVNNIREIGRNTMGVATHQSG
jgi:DNA gyrase/topoisomerase IV subunit A